MANTDTPVGFEILSDDDKHLYKAGAAIARGDMVAIVSGELAVFDISTHNEALGVAAHDIASGAYGYVYDCPEALFTGQTSGNFAASMIGAAVDVEGTTGIMEVNENAAVKGVVRIVSVAQDAGHPDATGNYTRVAFRIVRHALAAMPGAPVSIATNVTGNLTGNSTGTHTGAVIAAAGEITFASAANTSDVAAKIGVGADTPANAAGYGKGSLFFKTADNKLYVNTGTSASVTWTVVGTQS